MPSQPTESSLLSSFLLTPAPLPLAIPLPKFKELFPRAHRSSPDIPILYRELQYQVALGIDEVKQNITAEVRRGEETRAQVARARRKAEKNDTNTLANELDLRMDVDVRHTDILFILSTQLTGLDEWT
jgi:centromere-localized protein 2